MMKEENNGQNGQQATSQADRIPAVCPACTGRRRRRGKTKATDKYPPWKQLFSPMSVWSVQSVSLIS